MLERKIKSDQIRSAHIYDTTLAQGLVCGHQQQLPGDMIFGRIDLCQMFNKVGTEDAFSGQRVTLAFSIFALNHKQLAAS